MTSNRHPSIMKKILSYSFLFLVFGCDFFGEEPKTELEKLPPITQDGKYTFGCLVDEKAVQTRNSMLMRSECRKWGFYISCGITVDNKLWGEPFKDFYFEVVDPIEVGVRYTLPSSMHKTKFESHTTDTSCFYDYDDTFYGHITFSRIDRVKYIISGTFEFSTVNASCDTVTVTDGRFDMGYLPYCWEE